MSIRLIATDMDGTLLNKNNELSAANREMLIQCQKQGMQLILASGRGYKRLWPYAKDLLMPQYHGIFIESNGVALTETETKKQIIFEQMTLQEAKDLCFLFQPFQTEIQIYFDNGVYYYIPESIMPYKIREKNERNLPEDYPWMGGPWSWVNDTREGYPDQKRIYSFEEIHKTHINKINLSQNEHFLDQILPSIRKTLPKGYSMVRTCPRMLEIAPKTISKGNALAYFMKQHDISPDEAIVFGDGENDVSLFDVVKTSFAMGQAKEYVKKKASSVTKRNDEEGIWEALNSLGLLEE